VGKKDLKELAKKGTGTCEKRKKGERLSPLIGKRNKRRP